MSHIKYKVVPINQVPKGVRYAPFRTRESAWTLIDSQSEARIKRLPWKRASQPPASAKFAIVARTLDEIERMYKELVLES